MQGIHLVQGENVRLLERISEVEALSIKTSRNQKLQEIRNDGNVLSDLVLDKVEKC